MFRRWATKKSGGSIKNGRDSNPQFLGVKKFGGEVCLFVILFLKLIIVKKLQMTILHNACLLFVVFVLLFAESYTR